MGIDSQTALDGDGFARDRCGRFGKGNRGGPGRKRGPTPQTVSLERIKAAIIQSWADVDGPKLLRELAEREPGAYLKAVIGLIPREQRLQVESKQLVLNITPIPANGQLAHVPPTERALCAATYRDSPQLTADGE